MREGQRRDKGGTRERRVRGKGGVRDRQWRVDGGAKKGRGRSEEGVTEWRCMARQAEVGLREGESGFMMDSFVHLESLQ